MTATPDPAAPVAVADVVELVCHQEQLQVWADEMLADLAQGGYLYPDLSYADKVDLHRAVASEIKRIVSRAFDHPEAAAEIARLRAEVAELREGQARERARIVAWFRRRANGAAQHGWIGDDKAADQLDAEADMIERGEHWQWPGDRA